MAIVRRPWNKRRPRLGARKSGFKKAVTSIARKTMLRNMETKQHVVTASLPFGSAGLLLTSNGVNGLFNGIVNLATDTGRIGDKILVKGVKFRLGMDIDATLVTGRRETLQYRVVIATNKQDQLTTGMFPSFYTATNPERMTVLYDRYFQGSSTKWNVMLNKYLRFNRIARYVGDVCVGRNLYLYVVPTPSVTGTYTTTTGFGLNGTIEILYKDP